LYHKKKLNFALNKNDLAVHF